MNVISVNLLVFLYQNNNGFRLPSGETKDALVLRNLKPNAQALPPVVGWSPALSRKQVFNFSKENGGEI